jgi:hypothetical protein
MSNDNANNINVNFFIPELPLDTDIDGARTKAEGRPIYKTNEYVRVTMPANPKSVIVCLAHEKRFRDKQTNEWRSYADMYPEQYRQFKAGIEEQIIGTPLSELPSLTAAKRAELRAVGIKTVEQLRELDGVGLKRLGMEGQGLKTMAASYLDRAKGLAVDAVHAAENAALRSEMELLREEMKALAAGKVTPPANDANPAPVSDFDGFSDEDLKVFIKDRSGSAPRGNPSHSTLVRMAEELLAAEQEAA